MLGSFGCGIHNLAGVTLNETFVWATTFRTFAGMLRQNPIPVLSVTRTRCRQSCCMNWSLRINHKEVHMTADIATRWSWYGDRSSTSWTNRCRRNRKWKLSRIEMIGHSKFKVLWRHLKVDVGQFWMWDPQSRRCYPKRNVRVGNHISHFRSSVSPNTRLPFLTLYFN